MVADRSFWQAVWWLTVVAAACAVALFVVHWRRDRRYRPKRYGTSLYLHERSVMDLYQARYKEALEQEVEERVKSTRDRKIRLQVYGAGGEGGGVFDKEVWRRYVQTLEPITVIWTIIDALEASHDMVHVDLWSRRVERNRALTRALESARDAGSVRGGTVRLREVRSYVTVEGRFRCARPDNGGAADGNGTTVLLAPYGDPPDPADGPQVRLECVTTAFRGELPQGSFPARCVGMVQDWDPAGQQLLIRPIAIFH